MTSVDHSARVDAEVRTVRAEYVDEEAEAADAEVAEYVRRSSGR